MDDFYSEDNFTFIGKDKMFPWHSIRKQLLLSNLCHIEIFLTLVLLTNGREREKHMSSKATMSTIFGNSITQ